MRRLPSSRLVIANVALGVLMAVVSSASPSAAVSADPVPQSPRSLAAMDRVTPPLRVVLREAGVTWGAPVFLRLFKRESVLEVWLETTAGGPYALVRSYPVCAWSGALGPKTREGDGQAPEGVYRVPPSAMNPYSRFHLSFNLGMPNAHDRARGWTGSFLMVHGDCVSVGCYAMAKRLLPIGADRNDPIAEIWTLMSAAFEAGQAAVPVHAFPFRMTRQALAAQAGHPWAAFWATLAPVYDRFEQTRRPPAVTGHGGRYRVAGAGAGAGTKAQ